MVESASRKAYLVWAVARRKKATSIKIDLLLLIVALLNLWLTHRQTILASLRRRLASLAAFFADPPPRYWLVLRRSDGAPPVRR